MAGKSMHEEDGIKDILAELPKTTENIKSLNEILKVNKSYELKGIDCNSALFKNFFSPVKRQKMKIFNQFSDKSKQILSQNSKRMKILILTALMIKTEWC